MLSVKDLDYLELPPSPLFCHLLLPLQDLFMCILRNMFDEYKFFPRFPDKELQITGQLFGGIIEYGLVTYMTLSLALRYVLQSLKNPSLRFRRRCS